MKLWRDDITKENLERGSLICISIGIHNNKNGVAI